MWRFYKKICWNGENQGDNNFLKIEEFVCTSTVIRTDHLHAASYKSTGRFGSHVS